MARPKQPMNLPRPTKPQPQQQKKKDPDAGYLCFYYWPQKSGNWGHVSLKLNDDDQTYISWWPSGADKACQGLVPAKIVCDWVSPVLPNTLKKDSDNEGGSPAMSKIPLNYLSVPRMKQWWHMHARNNGYNGIRLNCSTTVYLALKHGGSEKYVATPNYWYWTPYRCYKYVEDMKANILNKVGKATTLKFTEYTADQLKHLDEQRAIADKKAESLKKQPQYALKQ